MHIQHIWLGLLWVVPTQSSWIGRSSKVEAVAPSPRQSLNLNTTDIWKSGYRLSEVYSVALKELQDLESEPLCHRVAARLLVGNCQLLDGKDEATILTDSGRKVRDFVDAYAASMAICDLERGRFVIPDQCDNFRENVLVQLPLRDDARLHVTSREIDGCLSGLASENSAWTTWISYRHKALRFCEAARADQEKSQSILLYQRLTKVMAKLTHDVEIEIQKHMDKLERRVQQAGETVDQLGPQIDRLRDGLARVEDYLSHDLDHALKRSDDSINTGLSNADNLQQLLSIMIKTILESNSHIAAAQEKSLALVSQKNDGLNILTVAVATAASSAAALGNQIELSRLEAQELAHRQQVVGEGLNRLINATDTLSSKYDDHTHLLNEAKNMTNDILYTLEDAAISAAAFNEINGSYFSKSRLSGWWPCIISPVATLLLGSYGLAPSALRNLGLVALGEVVGLSISSFSQMGSDWLPSTTTDNFTNMTATAL